MSLHGRGGPGSEDDDRQTHSAVGQRGGVVSPEMRGKWKHPMSTPHRTSAEGTGPDNSSPRFEPIVLFAKTCCPSEG